MMDPDIERTDLVEQLREHVKILQYNAKKEQARWKLPGSSQSQSLKSATKIVNLRHLVSGDKRRMQDGAFDLDLTYITPKVIAMSMPSAGSVALYRNKFEDVANFLEEKHGQGYKVFNLCSEYQYCSTRFANGTAYFPIADHEVPTVAQMLKFCKEAHDWITKDSRNVIAVHCKGGKGRTGTMICAYMMFTGEAEGAIHAMELFRGRRTTDEALDKGSDQGITCPSQRRFLYYFEDMMNFYRDPTYQAVFLPKRAKVQLNRLCLFPIRRLVFNYGPGCVVRASVRDYSGKKVGAGWTRIDADAVDMPYLDVVVRDERGSAPTLQDEFRVQLSVSFQGILGSGRKKLTFVWMHADFIVEKEICLSKDSLDILCRDDDDMIDVAVDRTFKCTLVFGSDEDKTKDISKIYADRLVILEKQVSVLEKLHETAPGRFDGVQSALACSLSEVQLIRLSWKTEFEVEMLVQSMWVKGKLSVSETGCVQLRQDQDKKQKKTSWKKLLPHKSGIFSLNRKGSNKGDKDGAETARSKASKKESMFSPRTEPSNLLETARSKVSKKESMFSPRTDPSNMFTPKVEPTSSMSIPNEGSCTARGAASVDDKSGELYEMSFHLARVLKFYKETSPEDKVDEAQERFVVRFFDGADLTLRVKDTASLTHLLTAHVDLHTQRRRVRVEYLKKLFRDAIDSMTPCPKLEQLHTPRSPPTAQTPRGGSSVLNDMVSVLTPRGWMPQSPSLQNLFGTKNLMRLWESLVTASPAKTQAIPPTVPKFSESAENGTAQSTHTWDDVGAPESRLSRLSVLSSQAALAPWQPSTNSTSASTASTVARRISFSPEGEKGAQTAGTSASSTKKDLKISVGGALGLGGWPFSTSSQHEANYNLQGGMDVFEEKCGSKAAKELELIWHALHPDYKKNPPKLSSHEWYDVGDLAVLLVQAPMGSLDEESGSEFWQACCARVASEMLAQYAEKHAERLRRASIQCKCKVFDMAVQVVRMLVRMIKLDKAGQLNSPFDCVSWDSEMLLFLSCIQIALPEDPLNCLPTLLGTGCNLSEQARIWTANNLKDCAFNDVFAICLDLYIGLRQESLSDPKASPIGIDEVEAVLTSFLCAPGTYNVHTSAEDLWECARKVIPGAKSYKSRTSRPVKHERRILTDWHLQIASAEALLRDRNENTNALTLEMGLLEEYSAAAQLRKLSLERKLSIDGGETIDEFTEFTDCEESDAMSMVSGQSSAAGALSCASDPTKPPRAAKTKHRRDSFPWRLRSLANRTGKRTSVDVQTKAGDNAEPGTERRRANSTPEAYEQVPAAAATGYDDYYSPKNRKCMCFIPSRNVTPNIIKLDDDGVRGDAVVSRTSSAPGLAPIQAPGPTKWYVSVHSASASRLNDPKSDSALTQGQEVHSASKVNAPKSDASSSCLSEVIPASSALTQWRGVQSTRPGPDGTLNKIASAPDVLTSSAAAPAHDLFRSASAGTPGTLQQQPATSSGCAPGGVRMPLSTGSCRSDSYRSLGSTITSPSTCDKSNSWEGDMVQRVHSLKSRANSDPVMLPAAGPSQLEHPRRGNSWGNLMPPDEESETKLSSWGSFKDTSTVRNPEMQAHGTGLHMQTMAGRVTVPPRVEATMGTTGRSPSPAPTMRYVSASAFSPPQDGTPIQPARLSWGSAQSSPDKRWSKSPTMSVSSSYVFTPRLEAPSLMKPCEGSVINIENGSKMSPSPTVGPFSASNDDMVHLSSSMSISSSFVFTPRVESHAGESSKVPHLPTRPAFAGSFATPHKGKFLMNTGSFSGKFV